MLVCSIAVVLIISVVAIEQVSTKVVSTETEEADAPIQGAYTVSPKLADCRLKYMGVAELISEAATGAVTIDKLRSAYDEIWKGKEPGASYYTSINVDKSNEIIECLKIDMGNPALDSLITKVVDSLVGNKPVKQRMPRKTKDAVTSAIHEYFNFNAEDQQDDEDEEDK